MSRTPALFGRMVPALLFAVVLGLPDGSIGIAWPWMRAPGALDRSVGDLGTLALASMLPYLAASAATGRTLGRFGVRNVLLASSAGGATGLAIVAAAPSWPAAVVGIAALGAGCGGIDGAVNAHLAVHGTQADLAFAHGTYGVGATVGPLLATAAVIAWRESGWRILFAAFAAMAAMTTYAVAVAAGRSDVDRLPPSPHATVDPRGRERARRGPTALTLMAFLAYTAAEGATGAWAYTLLTEGRGQHEAVAGLAVAGYWGGLTAGRFLLATAGGILARRRGAAADAWRASVVLHGGIGLATAGVAFLLVDPGGAGGGALPVVGVGYAGVFPLLVASTPARVGDGAARSVVGWSVAAAAVGGPAGVALVGAVADRGGPADIAPALVVSAFLLAVVHMALDRLAPVTE